MLVLFTIFLTIGSAFAGATIGVKFDKGTVHVNDTINLIITITNPGPDDLSNVAIYAPFPNGLNLMSFSTGTTKNNYNIDSGIWQVDYLRLSSRGGGVKTLTITAMVGPELAGKTVKATADYISVSSGDPPIPLNGLSGSSTTLKVLDNNTINSTNNSTNNSTGNETNNNTDNITNNVTDNSKNNITANDTNNSLIKNNSINLQNINTTKSALTQTLSNNNTNGTNIGKNGQILPNTNPSYQKAYEVYSNPNTENSPLMVYVVGLLAIMGLVAIGYFYGVKK